MAAETLSAAGWAVDVYERMPSVGRKFLMAGRGGLNLTHSEPLPAFLARYGPEAERLRPAIAAFPPAALVAWAEGLGQPTFAGSSGRVFPRALKASPLLRAWLARLSAQGVRFHTRHRWLGWTDDGALRFETPEGERALPQPEATILALGGASWPRLGSDGAWASTLQDQGVEVAAFRPANAGFTIAWSDTFRERFAGQPVKPLALTFARTRVRGEATVTRYGLEGGATYALSRPLREETLRTGQARLWLDLAPDLREDALTDKLAAPRPGLTLSNRLRKAANLSPVAVGLLREAHGVQLPTDAPALARAIKGAPLTITGMQGLDRAISSAGGLALSAIDADQQLTAVPGVYAAGEMLDWEAPTGGYLLQACFATGRAAALAVIARLGAA
jgi:hypothetical protein